MNDTASNGMDQGYARCDWMKSMEPQLDLNDDDRRFLTRCVDLAREALDAGDEPFGSVLVDADGRELFADRNRVAGGDHTRHPEFEIARWAADHLTPEQRAETVVFTSGEHCPMCSAAHAWVGLGRIVYASSSQQLSAWHKEWGLAPRSRTAAARSGRRPGNRSRRTRSGIEHPGAESARPSARSRCLRSAVQYLHHLHLSDCSARTEITGPAAKLTKESGLGPA